MLIIKYIDLQLLLKVFPIPSSLFALSLRLPAMLKM